MIFIDIGIIIGLGLIGLITCQLLQANSINVIGFDIDDDKIKLAQNFGINAVKVQDTNAQIKNIEELTDGVLITASNKSNEIISTSAKMRIDVLNFDYEAIDRVKQIEQVYNRSSR